MFLEQIRKPPNSILGGAFQGKIVKIVNEIQIGI